MQISFVHHLRLFISLALRAGACTSAFAQANDPRLLTCIAFGDSTTAPREVNGVQIDVYPKLVEKQLAGEGVIPRMLNKGVPGNTTVDALKRFAADVLAHQPNIVLIQFGINDSAIDVWRNPPDTKPRVPIAVYEANLRTMVQKLQDIGAEVVLMTPNPVRWTTQLRKLYGSPPYDPSDPDGWNVLLRQYAAVVRQVADYQKAALVDVYAAFNDYGKTEGRSTEELLIDGMHPNAKGHRLIADLIMRCLNRPPERNQR